jgi:hypothetical protein
MLPDEFFSHHVPRFPRQHRDRIVAAWRRAQRFQFSPAASTVAGRLRYEAPALVIEHREFAIPPFKTMYVEVDSRKFFAPAYPPPGMLAKDVDKRLGYLFDGDEVFAFAGGEPGEVAITPWRYRFGDGKDNLFLDAQPDDPAWRFYKMAAMLGVGAETVAAQRAMDDIVSKVAFDEFIPIPKELRDNHQPLDSLLKGSMGDVMNIWTMLLWLNQPARIQYTNEPAGRRFLRGKLTTYSAHRTVDIELGKFRKIGRAFLGGVPRTPSRRHDVRGSFHHHGGLAQGCGHEWVALPDEQLWQCKKCERRRWWVKEHERGDLSRGRVVHDYAVSAGDKRDEGATTR